MTSPAERNIALNGLTAVMQREFSAIWKRLNLNDPAVLRDPLAAVLAEIADKYGTAAATLAADFYDEMRADVVKTGASFTPKLAAVPPAERFSSLAGWGIGPLFGANPDSAQALHQINGGLQLIVGDAYRETIMGSSIADPAAQGWARVADANACEFCTLLASRGATYSEASADFASHAHCGCTAEPEFIGQPKLVQPFTSSTRRDRTDPAQREASNARARRWIAENL